MAKKILGIDIGHDRLKLALVKGKRVEKTAFAVMPKHLMRDGRVVSPEAMGELIRSTMRGNGIHCSQAALVIPNELTFIRTVMMPRMTAEQLVYNLPYEFRDYITDELKNYVFDYAMYTTPAELKAPGNAPTDDESTPENAMELMAVAVHSSVLEEAKIMFRKAGLKMVKAAPALCSFAPLIRNYQAEHKDVDMGEYCILDLGYQAIRMYMFKGGRHIVTRVLEVGLSSLDSVIADAYNIDEHLAHTYLLTNYDDCQNKEVCLNAYNNIAVELMRALNFYRFSNPDSQLADMWICGGANITSLREAIAVTLDINTHLGEELVYNGSSIENCSALVQAIGIAQD